MWGGKGETELINIKYISVIFAIKKIKKSKGMFDIYYVIQLYIIAILNKDVREGNLWTGYLSIREETWETHV